MWPDLPKLSVYACPGIHPSLVFAELPRLVEGTLADCMAAGQVPRYDPHEPAVALKALEEGYAFPVGV